MHIWEGGGNMYIKTNIFAKNVRGRFLEKAVKKLGARRNS